MGRRWVLPPVFEVAWRRSARGWGLYGCRSAAVAAMMVPMSVAYSVTTTVSPAEWIGLLPRSLRVAYRMVTSAELVMAFGLAPAMTAGAICGERRRGRLAGRLVTDLHAREIIVGKLAAGLARLAMMVGTTLQAALRRSGHLRSSADQGQDDEPEMEDGIDPQMTPMNAD